MIHYDTNQKSIGDTILINWSESEGGTRYELQYFQNEWISINNNITNTEYVYTFEQPNPTARFRVRGVNELGKTEWVEGKTFEVTNQSSIDGEIIINPQNKMRGYIPKIIGAGDSSINGSLNVRRAEEEDLDSTIRIPWKYETELIDGSITVSQRGKDDLDCTIGLNPSSRIRGYIDIVAPVKKTIKIYPTKDSVVRQSAPTINYGSSQQMMAGKSGEGYFISYLGFDLELPNDIDIESIKLVLEKQYDTSKEFSMGLYETSNDWEEDKITWDHRHWDETYITQFPISTGAGRVAADITSYKWTEGKKSFIVRPKDYRNSELVAFSTRESMNPPYIEVVYYEVIGSADSYSFDSSITIRQKEFSSIDASINLISDYIYIDLDGLLEIKKKSIEDDIEGSLVVSQTCHNHVDGELEIKKKPQEIEVDSSIIVPYRADLDSFLNIERIDGDSDLDSSIIIRRDTTEELDSSFEIKQKHINSDLDGSIVIGRDNIEELDSSLEIVLKNTDSIIDSSIYIRRPEDTDLDSSLNIDRKDCISDIDGSILVKRVGDSDLDSSLEVPRYDEQSDMDSSLYVKFRSDIDSSIEIPWVDSQDELDVDLNIEKKLCTEDLDSSMVVRVFWVDELESSIEIVRRFEIDASINIERNEVDNELEASIYIDSGGDYAFII